jgi:hypothetical protein
LLFIFHFPWKYRDAPQLFLALGHGKAHRLDVFLHAIWREHSFSGGLALVQFLIGDAQAEILRGAGVRGFRRPGAALDNQQKYEGEIWQKHGGLAFDVSGKRSLRDAEHSA